MTTKSWENIKENAVYEFNGKFTSNGLINNGGEMAFMVLIERLIDEKLVHMRATDILWNVIRKKAVEHIERTDIRSWKLLADIAPKSFPAWIKEGRFELEMRDSGWYFVKTDS